jgi:hypothetical protein
MEGEVEAEMEDEAEDEEVGAEEEEEEDVVEAVAFVTKVPPMKLSKPVRSLMTVSLNC